MRSSPPRPPPDFPLFESNNFGFLFKLTAPPPGLQSFDVFPPFPPSCDRPRDLGPPHQLLFLNVFFRFFCALPVSSSCQPSSSLTALFGTEDRYLPSLSRFFLVGVAPPSWSPWIGAPRGYPGRLLFFAKLVLFPGFFADNLSLSFFTLFFDLGSPRPGPEALRFSPTIPRVS